MYEKFHGSARLVFALEAAIADPAQQAALAHYLHYHAEQLAQDVQALSAVYSEYRAEHRGQEITDYD